MVRTVAMRPIGFVRTTADEKEIHANRRNVVSEVVLEGRLAPALRGIEAYSHVVVLFWMDQVTEEERERLTTHPRHRDDLPRVGIFAVRMRSRPNPIGLSVVELIGRRKNVLKVRGLDALDGTPVLDVKPYDHMDVKEGIAVPEWWFKDHQGGRSVKGGGFP
ncbi:MAG: tRNA (N6-threonylcarbamoyladenosine(37)-N6)-methyltransferase TrmO [Thaumarchaeota archaeon]|nr:tRNA (N6-threonylcarbamoyladenosine(37)-N6)-methyltransferase TrmO [Nitrososphaerota archaeon]